MSSSFTIINFTSFQRSYICHIMSSKWWRKDVLKNFQFDTQNSFVFHEIALAVKTQPEFIFFFVYLKYGKRKKMESWMILLLYLPHFHSVLDTIFVMLHSIFCPSFLYISFLQWYMMKMKMTLFIASRKCMCFKVKGKNFMSCWCNLAALCKRRWIEIIGSKHDNVFHLILCYFI